MKSSGKRKFRPGNGFEINVFASPCPAANASIVAGRNRTVARTGGLNKKTRRAGSYNLVPHHSPAPVQNFMVIGAAKSGGHMWTSPTLDGSDSVGDDGDN
jgi:hypothetical protein